MSASNGAETTEINCPPHVYAITKAGTAFSNVLVSNFTWVSVKQT
jgi:hypothetical protein